MSTLAILNGDWEILFDDETVGGNAVAGMRMVRRASGASSTIYTSLQLYSAIADAADEFTAMGFRNPALPVTPNAFTLENKYFMPRSSTEWLKEGTWTADWSYTASPNSNGNGVVCVAYTDTVADFAVGDIGRQVTGGTTGDTGTLLDFEIAPDGTKYAWIRPDDSTPTTGDVFDNASETLTATGDGGTGNCTTTAVGIIGNTRYTAIQAIGSVPAATDVYVYQDRQKLTDYQGNFQWWTTDETVSLGIISILVRTHLQAATITAANGIAGSDLEVFARRYTSLYDNFRLNVAGGGFSALPLASAPDINNTTGYATATLSGGTGTWDVGSGIYVGASWAAATAKGVITSGGSGATPTLEYYLVGDLTAIANTDSVTEYVFSTQANGDASGTINGVPGNTSGGPTDATSGQGGTVTLAVGHTTSDFDGDGTAEPFSVTVDCQTNVPVAKVYERLKYVTRRGAPNTDLFGAGVNIPGESYRGLEALYYSVSHSVSLTEGDDLTQTTGGNLTCRLLGSNQTGAGQGVSQSYITVTDQQTSLESLVDADVLDDEAADQVTIDTGGAGGASLSISSPKASPLGTFTGTTIFGAQGVLFSNIDNDPQAYTLTDDLGVLRTPPNTVTVLIDNTAAGDRVYVARDTGVAGVIDKDRLGGMTVTAISATSITVGGTIDSEVPQAAWVRVIAVDEQQEHHYKYDSRTGGASGVFTLTPITAASATAGTSDTALSKTGGPSFITEGVEIGMLVHVATRTSTYEVVSVDGADDLTIQLLYGSGGFVSGDAYTINETIQGYDTNDNLHELIIDTETAAGSSSNTLIKTPAANFGVVVNVRQGKVILPFTQNATVGDSGVTVTVVRQDDTIAV
jgi:hypothetical protein